MPLGVLPMQELRDHLGVSLTGGWLLAVAARAALAASGGRFVLLTSEAGFEGKRLLPAYAAVKAAQRGFARALAREWGPAGITVNCVAPLAMTPAMERAFGHDPAMEQRVTARDPARSGRLARAGRRSGRRGAARPATPRTSPATR